MQRSTSPACSSTFRCFEIVGWAEFELSAELASASRLAVCKRVNHRAACSVGQCPKRVVQT